MKSKIQLLGIVLISIIVVSSIIYGAWTLKRKFHYSFGYQSEVESSIRKLVKQECLK